MNMNVNINLIFCMSFMVLVPIKCRRVKRVINGIQLDCGSQPRVSSLRNISSGTHLCGATLLSERAALTAAHCVHAHPSCYYLQLNNVCGTNGIVPSAKVLETHVHKEYNKYTRAHDIAVLSISLDLENIKWLKDDILPKSTFGLSGDCMIAGYGVTDVNSKETSDILRAGTVTIISLDECTKRLGAFVAPGCNSGMICALGDCADTCQGDSGGPLLCNGVLEGVTSHGLSCGAHDLPAIYTGIGGHLTWIRHTLDNLKSNNC